MRKEKKEIKDRTEVRRILASAPVGRLGTIGSQGYPMVKPLNFVLIGESVYFHSAREGEKMEDIERDDRVCFEVDLPLGYVKARGNPCGAFYRYRSVILTGRARIVENPAERRAALAALMEKYQPEGGYGDIPEEKLRLTAVVRIDMEQMSGKEDLKTR